MCRISLDRKSRECKAERGDCPYLLCGSDLQYVLVKEQMDANPTLQGVLLDLELTVFKTKVRAPKCFSLVSQQKWDCHHGFTIPITITSQSLVPFLYIYCAHLSSLVPATVPVLGCGSELERLPSRHEALHWVPALKQRMGLLASVLTRAMLQLGK